MRLRVEWEAIRLYLGIEIPMSMKGQNLKFCLRLKLDLHAYFHAAYALLPDFEIFNNFDLIFDHFQWYNRVGPKIWTVNTSIWPVKNSYTKINGFFTFFGLHARRLKMKIINFRHWIGYNISEQIFTIQYQCPTFRSSPLILLLSQ